MPTRARRLMTAALVAMLAWQSAAVLPMSVRATAVGASGQSAEAAAREPEALTKGSRRARHLQPEAPPPPTAAPAEPELIEPRGFASPPATDPELPRTYVRIQQTGGDCNAQSMPRQYQPNTFAPVWLGGFQGTGSSTGYCLWNPSNWAIDMQSGQFGPSLTSLGPVQMRIEFDGRWHLGEWNCLDPQNSWHRWLDAVGVINFFPTGWNQSERHTLVPFISDAPGVKCAGPGPFHFDFVVTYSDPRTNFIMPDWSSWEGWLGVQNLKITTSDPGGTVGAVPTGTEHNGHPNGALAGDPVATFTGSLTDTQLDLTIPGRGPAIAFQRTYYSNDTRLGSMGPGWTHSYGMRLVAAGAGSQDLYLIGPQGRSDRYTRNPDGTYAPPKAILTTLTANPDGTFTAAHRDQSSWSFDVDGRLTAIRDRFGNTSTLGYDGGGQLTSISDPAGRGSLTLAYTAGKLTSLTDWASPARTVIYQYDASGRLWKVTDREGQVTTYTYEGTSHRLATVTDERGNVALTNTYDALGRVATQKDARGLTTGETTTYAYTVNPDGTRVTTITAPPTSLEPGFAPSLTDSYDANGWLTQRVTRPSSTETLTQSFTYDAGGNRTSATDARGNRTDFCYDVDYAGTVIPGAAAHLTRRIDPPPATGASRPVTLLAYDAKHNVIQTVSPRGVPSDGTVTCSTNLAAVNAAFAVDFTYDAAGASLLSTTSRFTDPDAGLWTAVTKYEYADAANPGLVTRLIPPRGNSGASPDYTYATTFSYFTTGTKAGLLKDVTDALGNRTSYDYDPVGRLISSVDPVGNAAGGVPAQHTTTFSYDREDRLRFQTLPAPVAGGAGLVSETRYDPAGNPTVRIDPAGQVTTFAYDNRNSLASVTESAQAWTDPANPPPSTIVTIYTRDAGGNLTRITRAAGDAANERVTDYAYDGRGLLRRETQYPAWPSTTGALVASAAFDANGNRLTTVDPLGRTTTFGHDALDRLTAIDYSDAGTPDVSYAYDADGNRTSLADGTGTTTYLHDEAGRLTSVTSPGSVTVGYRYDLDGNRTKLIYPDATAVTYSLNKGGQLASLTDWASRSVAYTYAPDGLVRTATNPDGSTATYTYDNARRLVDILHLRPGGARIDRFAYTLDAGGNVTAVGSGSLATQYARPDGLVTSNGAWTGTFADVNETPANDVTFLASPSGPSSANIYELSLGNVEPPHTRTGIVVRYRYAKSGNNSGKTTNLAVELRQGATVIASKAHTNIPGVSGSGWQAGTFTLTTAQANAITDFADLRLRLVPSSSGGGQSRMVQLSWAEVEFPSAGDPASEISYGYDRLYRLTSAQDSSGTTAYTYDPVGNRLTAGGTAATYDRADRITAAGATAITVDANGNLTAKGADSFSFDQASRLTSATVAGAGETYAYDGDGTRFSRRVGSNPAIRYVSDVAGGLPVTIDDGTRKYVYGLGLAYAVAGSSIEVYHADHLGSVRALTNGSGVVTATYRTDAWGVQTQVTGSSTQPFGFTGEPRDATGLTFLRARTYDPTLGRFLSRDTWAGGLSAPQSLNRYSYVTNNPARYADPSGECGIDLIADIGFSAFSLGQVIFGPEKERGANFGYLLLDVGGTFIPCGAGLGTVSRTLRAADELADASRAGKPFTPRGRAEVLADNAAQNGGTILCANCGTEVVPGTRSVAGQTPPANEAHVDHIRPRSQGGAGAPSNGQVLCRSCNLEKSDTWPWP